MLSTKGPSRGRPLIALAALAIVLTAGCKQAESKAPAPSSTLSEVDKVKLMEAHYTAAITGHDMLIRGNFDAYVANLRALSEVQLPENAPAQWKGPHDHLLKAAAKASQVADLAAAANAMAGVVQACGGCHGRNVGGPVYRTPKPKPGDKAITREMRSHQWASERLWEGVTGPRDASWKTGSSVLATANIFAADAEASEQQKRLERTLRERARGAAEARSLEDRAAAYGRLLVTCAACHVASKVDFQGR